MLLALTMTGSLLLAACTGGSSQPPVIAEKNVDAVSQTGGQPENEKKGVTESAMSMINPPDKYQTEIFTDRLSVVCDAVIEIPDQEGFPVYEMVCQPYSMEEYRNLAQILADEVGTSWKTEPVLQEDGQMDVESEDGRYLLSFVSGEQGTTPILWMNCLGAIALVGEQKDPDAFQKQMEAASEQLLRTIGLEGFCLSHVRKVEGSVLRLVYRKNHGELPVMEPGSAYLRFGIPADALQYVSLTYSPDGRLVQFKNIGRENVEKSEQTDGFLLPFSAVAQVFELYLKTCCDSENAKVTRVALEYRPVWNKESGAGVKKGQIIPVWNFYGSLAPDEETVQKLFVSIGAADGTIFAGR